MRPLAAVVFLSYGLVTGMPALANLRVTPELSATFTATSNGSLQSDSPAKSNGSLQPDALAKSDVIVDIVPRLRMEGSGGGYTLNADLTADALMYAANTSPNRILPSGFARLVSTVSDRWLYLDTSVQVEQSVANPFGVLSDTASSANRITTARYAVAPYLSHEFSPTLSLLARTERRWIRRYVDDTASVNAPNANEVNDAVRLTERGQPFGYSLEYDGQHVTFEGENATILATAAGRAVASYAFEPETVFSLVAGREQNEFSLSRRSDTIYGLRFKWAPSERTSLSIQGEKRFFGNGWEVGFAHRSPMVALAFNAVRRLTALASSHLLGGQGTTAGLLDSMLTTRYPDPAARSQLVQQLISQLGLPAQLSGAVEVFSDAPQLERGMDFSGALRGRLTTLTLSLYVREYLLLARSDDPLSSFVLGDAANKQYGATLSLNRRLDALTAVTLVGGYSRLRSLGQRTSGVTNQGRLGLNVTRQLGPATTLNAGLRRQIMTTTVVNEGTVHESAVFVGLGQRF